MKKFLLVFALSLLLMPGVAAAYDRLSIHLTDGSKVDVNLCDEMSITFTPTELVATTDGVDVKVSRSEISHFSHSTTSGISDIEYSGTDFGREGNSIVFSALPENSEISVYNLAGIEVLKTTVGGDYTLSLDGYAQGVYVVTVNNISYKIAVK